MKNGLGAFGIEKQDLIDGISLDLTGFEDIKSHLGLTDDSKLNIWALPYDLQNQLEEQRVSEISLTQILENLGIESYVLYKKKFGNSKNLYEEKASFGGSLNIYNDLNINESFSGGTHYNEIVYFFNKKDPRSGLSKFLAQFKKEISEIIIVNK